MTTFIAELWDQEIEDALRHWDDWREKFGGQYIRVRKHKWWPWGTKVVWQWDEGRGPADFGDTIIHIPRIEHL